MARPLNSSFSSKTEFDLCCTKKSIELLQNAINKNTLPGFGRHLFVCLLGIPIDSIVDIIYRVGTVVSNILALPFLACPCASDRCSTLKFRLIRLALDPLYLLAGIIRIVMKIAASLLGLAVPQWGAKIWMAATQLEAFMLRRYSYIWDRDETGAPVTKMLDPEDAIQYFGKEETLAVRNQEQIRQLQNGIVGHVDGGRRISWNTIEGGTPIPGDLEECLRQLPPQISRWNEVQETVTTLQITSQYQPDNDILKHRLNTFNAAGYTVLEKHINMIVSRFIKGYFTDGELQQALAAHSFTEQQVGPVLRDLALISNDIAEVAGFGKARYYS